MGLFAWKAVMAALLPSVGTGMASPVYPLAGNGTANGIASVPDYVLKYAPLIWIHSEDPYNPGDIGQFLENSVPQIDHTTIEDYPSPLTLDTLNVLNELGGDKIYLTSKEGIRALPPWFEGTEPNSAGKTEGATSAVIVTTDHGNSVLDAFYFYWYPYNQGNTVIGIQFGNHVGDWEHNMIRFENGEPQEIWYSQHALGQAFTFEATEKINGRPVGYSSKGSHATWPSDGTHEHTIPGIDLPGGLLEDETDAGTLWDPIKSAWFYSYDPTSETFTTYVPGTPVNWLYYNGQWGDQQLPDDWDGQINLFGQRKYTSGPNGPKFKDLNRENVCPAKASICIPLPFLP